MLTASLFVRNSYAISMPVYSFLLRSANKTNITHLHGADPMRCFCRSAE